MSNYCFTVVNSTRGPAIADNPAMLSHVSRGLVWTARCTTETQLLVTSHDLLKHIDQGKQVDVLILDFSKAFDTVPHRRLLGKLEHYGVRDNLLRWTGVNHSWLADSSQFWCTGSNPLKNPFCQELHREPFWGRWCFCYTSTTCRLVWILTLAVACLLTTVCCTES